MTRRLVVLTYLCLIFCMGVPVSGAKETDIPSALKPWKEWVLYGEEEKACPTYYNNGEEYCCIWPSRLGLSLNAKGGTFEQQWLVLAEGWVPLPGNKDTWPVEVRANGEKVPVTQRNGAPHIKLKAGEYTVKGIYSWARMPEMILVPPASGIVSLSIDGKDVTNFLQEKDGRLWLKRSQVEQAVEDRMEVRVYRLINDTIPMEITTLLKVNISGKAREVTLENVLVSDFLAMELESPIPARIASGGNLTVQARPGQWEIYVKGRSQAPVYSLGPLKTSYDQEVWAFAPQNDLRMVRIEGVSAVDPTQTDSPGAWRGYSTYLINDNDTITFTETSRGDSNPAPDQLSLQRTWWLDFNGKGLTIRDIISGTMSTQWYLAMNPPVELGRVTIDGTDQLITEQEEERNPGVELRKGRLDMTAESRIEASGGSYSAVGWDHDFQSVSGTLNLPPGWRLITVDGVDSMPGTWFQKWTLLDLFLVLILSLVVYRLWGRIPCILALVTLVLTYHETGAPRYIWISILASLALIRFIPQGWFKRIVRFWCIASIIVLLIIAIPFMVQQIRWGIYPQLEPQYDTYEQYDKMEQRKVSPMMSSAPLSEEFTLEQITTTARKRGYYENQAIDVIDKDALNQTGPGIPSWDWHSYSMTWNGPVEKSQEIRFWLISPFANLVLSFVRVTLLCLFIFVLIAPQYWKSMNRRLSFISCLGLLFLFIPCASMAQTTNDGFPPDSMLTELKKRLLEKPDCLPYCADIPRMEITATPDNLRIILQVEAATDTAIPLPGGLDSWLPEQVIIGSAPAVGIMRDDNGTLHLLVQEGIQSVTLTGPIIAANDFQVPLPLAPRRISFSGNGWDVQGIDSEGRAESGIKLIRKEKALDNGGEEEGQTTVQSFFQVERIISLGLDWQVRTRVTRLTSDSSTALLSIPLIEGESVTTSGIRVENGTAHVQIAPDAREIRWDSTLKKEASLTLKSPTFVSWTEVWAVEASTIWHCEYTGVPVIYKEDDEGTYRPKWQPWPGEELTIEITRPKAVQGQVVTIDSASLSYSPGERITGADLSMDIRTSKGGQHQVVLPEGAKVQRITIQGIQQPIVAQGREIGLSLQPGSNTIYIGWNQASGSSMLVRTPDIQIGDQAVNADITIEMPENRWILWTFGPRMGPAVLFWSYLIVIVLFALVLGRVGWTPLKTRHWLLLGLGLTQVHPLVAIMIVGWLLALGQRKERPMPEGWFAFNATQVFLVIWTIAALIGLYIAIKKGLLGIPDMQISGNDSSDFYLHWTQDRIGATMPRPAVLSLHLMVFRFMMLAWALWLAYSLIKWLKWGWECFHAGDAWRRFGRKDNKNDLKKSGNTTMTSSGEGTPV